MRHDPSMDATGTLQGTGPLAGSASGVDHNAHRQEVFGDYRDVDETLGSHTCPECGQLFPSSAARAGHQATCGSGEPVEPEDAAALYVEYWTTEASQYEIAKKYGHNQRNTSAVIGREMHADATEEAARRLGYPEGRDWPSGSTRKVDFE